MVEVIDEEGARIGVSCRSECHSNPRLLHKAVHVLVLNTQGLLILQKRSRKKDVEPGKWDSSVGGHVRPGEDWIDAAKRELKEELGVDKAVLTHLYHYLWESQIERELIHTFSCVYDGPLRFNHEEIDAVRPWSVDEIEGALGMGVFTPNFELEFRKWRSFGKRGSP